MPCLRVQIAVPGQQERGAVADFQVVRRQGDALPHHLLHLRPQVFGVQRHTVPEHIDHTPAENAGGQQVQREFSVFVDDGVPRVAAALIADDHIIVPGEQVHHPALALVPPVDAHNCAVCHCFSLSFGFRYARSGAA